MVRKKSRLTERDGTFIANFQIIAFCMAVNAGLSKEGSIDYSDDDIKEYLTKDDLEPSDENVYEVRKCLEEIT